MAILTAAELKALPGINYGTLTDAQITRAIAQAQALIESYCDRKFDSSTYSAWLDGGGQWLRLPNYPIVSVERLSTQYGNVLQITPGTVTQIRATVHENILTIWTDYGPGSIALTSALTMATLGDAITVAMGTGVTTTVIQECAAWSLRPGVYGGYSSNQAIYIQGPLFDDNAYISQPDTGMLYAPGGWPSGRGSVYVEYTAGYSTYPYDLQMVCAQVAMDSADMTMANITQEKIGNVTYSYGARGIYGLLAGHESVLNKYRRLI